MKSGLFRASSMGGEGRRKKKVSFSYFFVDRLGREGVKLRISSEVEGSDSAAWRPFPVERDGDVCFCAW